MDHCKTKSATMKDTIFKAGEQTADDPYTFVMSTDSVDRLGDIVEQDWKLAEFKKNPIALFGHRHDQPIGKWEKVRVESGRLLGRLKLADPGTSTLIDTLRKLIEQRILKAVSVGFRPGEYEPLDEKEPWKGLRLMKNTLLECSLVTVPANAEALSVAKALIPDSVEGIVETDAPRIEDTVPASKQLGLGSRDSDAPSPPNQPRPKRNTTMSLSQKIAARKEHIGKKKDHLLSLTADIGDEVIAEEIRHQIEEVEREIAAAESDLALMLKAEAALAQTAMDRDDGDGDADGSDPAPVATRGQGTPVPRITARQNRQKGFRAVASVAAMLQGHVLRQSPIEVAKAHYKDNPELETVIRAATAPADMATGGWAAELVQETWASFLDLVRDVAVYPNLPGLRLEFDRYGKITAPKNVGRGNLAGGFIAEGAPIPVKQGVYGASELTPKKLAVISSFTKEIAEHSMPAIQALVQNQMIEDTAEVLDTLYLDANARDTVRPAGLQDATETGAGNINASTGNTVAAVLADTQAAIERLLTARSGNGGVWIINPLRLLGLRDMQDAASGEFVFRDELANGMFRGYPFLESQNVTADVVTLQGNGAMVYANDYAPRIEVSDETTLVYDDTAPTDVLPLAAADATTAQPTKSMFQIDSVAVKMKQGLDWRLVRAQGSVQVLTGVGW